MPFGGNLTQGMLGIACVSAKNWNNLYKRTGAAENELTPSEILKSLYKKLGRPKMGPRQFIFRTSYCTLQHDKYDGSRS